MLGRTKVNALLTEEGVKVTVVEGVEEVVTPTPIGRRTISLLFDFTAAGVVPCGGRKTSPRTSTIVQFIFHFWSFEISERILRNQKLTIGLDSYSRQFIYLDLIWIYIYISLFIDCLFEIHKIAVFFSCFRCKVITGSLMRIKYLKLRSMAHLLSLECVHCS